MVKHIAHYLASGKNRIRLRMTMAVELTYWPVTPKAERVRQ
jgi:hypothetical protein